MGLDTLKTVHHFREYLSRGAAVGSSHQICMCAPHRRSDWAFEKGCCGNGGTRPGRLLFVFCLFPSPLFIKMPSLLLSTSLV